jgi:acyl carrier protein
MGLPLAKLDVERPLSQLGIDSLMAVELKNRVELAFKTVMPMVDFLQGPSIRRLSSLLLEQVSNAGDGAAEADADSEWEIVKI